MSPVWQERAPKWISTKNLSPLSLEAHAIDRAGVNHVDHVFRLEDPDDLNRWLSRRLEKRLFPTLSFSRKPLKPLPHINQSEGGGTEKDSKDSPTVSDKSLNAIRKMFPAESKIYNL